MNFVVTETDRSLLRCVERHELLQLSFLLQGWPRSSAKEFAEARVSAGMGAPRRSDADSYLDVRIDLRNGMEQVCWLLTESLCIS